MKSLALVALIAVPRPAMEFLGERFTGWRKLFRACLTVINFIWERTLIMLLIAAGVLLTVCGSLAYAWFIGGNS